MNVTRGGFCRWQPPRVDLLRFGAGQNAVPAPYFPVDDGNLQPLFATLNGGRDARIDQEHEPFTGVFVEVFGQALVDISASRPEAQVAKPLGVVFVGGASQPRRIGRRGTDIAPPEPPSHSVRDCSGKRPIRPWMGLMITRVNCRSECCRQ